MDLTWLDTVSVANLRVICRRHSHLTSRAILTRPLLYTAVASLPEEVRTRIRCDVESHVASGGVKYRRSSDDNPRPRQRVRLTEPPPVQSSCPVDAVLSTPSLERATFNDVGPDRIQHIIDSDFLRAPTEAVLDERVARFIDASSSTALTQSTCGVCARIRFKSDLKHVLLARLPNREKLIPWEAHPAHDLHNGMLLHTPSLTADGRHLAVCGECLLSLKNGHRPRFSLANNMWIGDVPQELQQLTLPERMLIARYFPAAFIVKLFPKHKGARSWDRSQMHNALRGNVSTYRLDPKQVVSLVDGRTYPPHPNILCATIGITFVGPKGIREATMPHMFRVRRDRVRRALEWLQLNNPLYQDIIISADRLDELPEDDVPEQLVRTAKYSGDIEQVEREHAGYVPDHEEEDDDDLAAQAVHFAREAGLEAVDEDDEAHGPSAPETEPGVFPVQHLGVVDIEGHDITSSELLAHALSNAAQPPRIPGEDFTIRRGSAFVNEYARKDPVSGLRNDGGPSNANHLLGSFPCLFPYAKGGFEVNRDVEVPYEAHARWAMEYHDKRFRKDGQFPFQIFGVIQKRQVCRSAVLQMGKAAFARNIHLINLLTPADLEKASQEETRGASFSHPGIRALRDEMAGVRTKVKGTDESRFSVRAKIWGTNLVFNPPTLWITINPADTQNPVAQVLAGAEGIDLDAFCRTVGPDRAQRATNMAEDPFASAQYFHLTIRIVLEELFGIKKHVGGKVEREYGVLGKVQAYIGTVEAQGRGTLHLHMLMWLKDAPSARELKAALSSAEFRQKMTTYIGAVIKADIEGKTKAEVLAIPVVKGASYTRPLDPRTTTPEERTAHLAQLVRALQYHKCTPAACLKVVRGRLQCKRRAPFRTAAQDWVDEVGAWGAKRLCDMLNAFNPSVMQCIAANHDLKLIIEGEDTATINFYITNYATKKQTRSSNVSALLAKSLAFTKELDKREKDYNKANKRLIQRCANSLTRYREFSAPEIMTYIMNWGDVYESHHYVTIYWDGVAQALRKLFPELTPSALSHLSNVGSSTTASVLAPVQQGISEEENVAGAAGYAMSTDADEVMGNQDDTAVAPNVFPAAENQTASNGYQEMGTVDLIDGKPVLKDNLRDYKYRGDELQHLNFLDFMLNTYDGEAPDDSEDNDSTEPQTPQRGRPRNTRVMYKPEAKKPKTCRIVRTAGHETLPRFSGKWFPRNNGTSFADREMYAASMLALLKPWTEMRQLKGHAATFQEAFDLLLAEGDRKIHTVVHNIQYYYDCLDGAKARQEREKMETVDAGNTTPLGLDWDDQEISDAIAEAERNNASYLAEGMGENLTKEDIEIARLSKYDPKEAAWGESSIVDAYDVGCFDDEVAEDMEWAPVSRLASWTELPKFQTWDQLLKATTRKNPFLTATTVAAAPPDNPGVAVGRAREIDVPPDISLTPCETTPGDQQGMTRMKLALLNAEQRRAHDIVEKTIQEELAGSNPPQLRMLILGQGGTGKSMLIGAITETMEHYGVSSWLAKTGSTGIAASEILGQTVHAWAGLPRQMSKDDRWFEKTAHATQVKRQRNMEGTRLLVLDEISMVLKATMYLLSEIVGNTRARDFQGSAVDPFGGMHVILAGDFHQFPPVGNPNGALYVHDLNDSPRALIGREIFLQFQTVVILRQQIRTRDVVWAGILDRLRVGGTTFQDIEKIEKLVLSNPACDVPDFQQKPWSDAILVTPRHSVREKWNEHALVKHCRMTGNLRYICPAEDIDRSTNDVPNQLGRYVVAGMRHKDTGHLVDSIAIAIGMKAMVILNLATEADVANGTRGVIEDIILDPREGEVKVEEGTVHLKYPPALLYFRPTKPTDLVFPGVPSGLIPIAPFEAKFTGHSSAGRVFRFKRRQYALTPGYAFTDYKSQGQTIEYVIIDITNPPTGAVTPFGAYVALSRSRGRDTIRLLRYFDRKLFADHPSQHLRVDMERLDRLDRRTKERWENGNQL